MPLTPSDWPVLSTVNNSAPNTVASAATIEPLTFLTILTGNVAIANIIPPVTHSHMIAIEFAGTAGVAATGNIKTAKASVVGSAMLLIYNPIILKYIPVG